MDENDENRIRRYLSSMDVYDFVAFTESDQDPGLETYGGRAYDGNDTYYPITYPIQIGQDNNEQIGELIAMMLTMRNSQYQKTIGIDYRLLNKNVAYALIFLYNKKYINGIRILPEGHALDENIYNLFDVPELDNNFIICTDKMNIPFSRFDTRIQRGLVKMERLAVQNSDYIDDNIHINRELNDDELKQVVDITNHARCNRILFNTYNPNYCRHALMKLKEYGLNKKISLELLANPLYDNISEFEGLDSIIENHVTIRYNSCNDLNNLFRKRSSAGQIFYSDLEASQTCSISEYINVLKKVTEIADHINAMGYSDLEKVAYLYDYFKKNYIYDPLFKSTSHGLNAYLHNIVDRDRMVCEGFSNLFSCILRRCGLKCFTVGTNNHQFNVLRIKDEKYGIDNLAMLDITNDVGRHSRGINNNFKYFMLPPDALLYRKPPTVLNICSSLYIPQTEYDRNLLDSNPAYVIEHFGYARRMLELMGLKVKNLTNDEIRSAYLNSGLGKTIPSSVLIQAVNSVRKKENDSLFVSQSDFYSRDDFKRRNPTIVTNYGVERPVSLLTPDHNISFEQTESVDSIVDSTKNNSMANTNGSSNTQEVNNEGSTPVQKSDSGDDVKQPIVDSGHMENNHPVINPTPEPTFASSESSKAFVEESFARTPKLRMLLEELRSFNTSLMTRENYNKANSLIAKVDKANRVNSDDFKLDIDDEMTLAEIRSMADAYDSKRKLVKKIDVCEAIINANTFYEEPFKDCIKEFYNIIGHTNYVMEEKRSTSIRTATTRRLLSRKDYERFKRIFDYYKRWNNLSSKEEFADLNINIEEAKKR